MEPDSIDDNQDRHCMERLREGDDLALNELMQRWKKPLESFCLRYTGNPTDAREIAHETFVRVYQARQRYRPASKFSTWMFAIATNLARMRSRWKSRHPEIFESDRKLTSTLDHVAAAGSDPSIQTNVRLLAADLQHAIGLLSPKLRIPFLLHEIQGIPYREIATIENTTVKAVERRMARARQQLRSHLEADWGSQ